ALMELGAAICLPKDPLCDACPVSRFCEACRQGTAAELPSKRKKPQTIRETRTLLLIRRDNKVLLEPGSRVKGFWDLPGAVKGARLGTIVGEFRHQIMNRQYRFIVRWARVNGPLNEIRVNRTPKEMRWVDDHQLDEILLSTTAKKALRCLKES